MTATTAPTTTAAPEPLLLRAEALMVELLSKEEASASRPRERGGAGTQGRCGLGGPLERDVELALVVRDRALVLEARDPLEPAGQVPVGVPEQLHRGRQEHGADER